MSISTRNLFKSQKKILVVLRANKGKMSVEKLFDKMEEDGLDDATLNRLAIWNLIADAKVKRDADQLVLEGSGE